MANNLLFKLIIKKLTQKNKKIFIDKYNFKICPNITEMIMWSNWYEYVGGENGGKNNN